MFEELLLIISGFGFFVFGFWQQQMGSQPDHHSKNKEGCGSRSAAEMKLVPLYLVRIYQDCRLTDCWPTTARSRQEAESKTKENITRDSRFSPETDKGRPFMVQAVRVGWIPEGDDMTQNLNFSRVRLSGPITYDFPG